MDGMKNPREEAVRCLACPNARCQASCPCGNQIPQVIAAYKRDEEEEAAKILYQTNPFPTLTSSLCDHDRQCRGHCVRGIRGEPVDFPCIEFDLGTRFPFPYKKGKDNGKRAAIIGAGPANLSAATFLLQAGFAVEIFEKQASIGGAILTGIPNFRFDKSFLAKTQKDLETLGAVFHFGHEVRHEELIALSQRFDHVLVAIGAEKENRLETPACPDIHAALGLLEDMNLRDDVRGLRGKRIIVMGGGNVAMDVSRSLRRAGNDVTLIYRRDEASMPAQTVEIAEAKEDGVVFNTLTNVTSYHLDEAGRLKGLRLIKMQLGEKDASGRPSFSPIEGSEFDVDCDAFVMAIGEKSALADFLMDVELPNVHAIGDCKYGARNIASAIKDGRECALSLIGE